MVHTVIWRRGILSIVHDLLATIQRTGKHFFKILKEYILSTICIAMYPTFSNLKLHNGVLPSRKVSQTSIFLYHVYNLFIYVISSCISRFVYLFYLSFLYISLHYYSLLYVIYLLSLSFSLYLCLFYYFSLYHLLLLSLSLLMYSSRCKSFIVSFEIYCVSIRKD